MKKWKYKVKEGPNKTSKHYQAFMKQWRAYLRFIDKNGRLPQQSNSINKRPIAESRLYTWASQVKNQARKRTLSQWKYDLMIQIPGFIWNKQSNVWFTKFFELKEYIEKYGEAPTQLRCERFPERLENGKWISPVDAKLHSLSVWCMQQRKLYREDSLLPDRLNHLIDIDFNFEPHNGPIGRKNGVIPGMDTEENIQYLLKRKVKATWKY